MSEVIQAFLVESPKLVVQIEQALLLGGPRQLELAAHSLRGGLGYLGAPEISEALRNWRTPAGLERPQGWPIYFLACVFAWPHFGLTWREAQITAPGG